MVFEVPFRNGNTQFGGGDLLVDCSISLTARSSWKSHSSDDYLRAAAKKPSEFMFASRRGSGRSITTRQYARFVFEWIASIVLDPDLFGTHSLRRTKASLIYRRTGNLRAVQILLGHLGIEVDDALAIAEQVDI
jgi:integrase